MKRWNLMAIVLLCCALYGCKLPQEPQHYARLVTHIQISHNGITQEFDDPHKIEEILSYLRTLPYTETSILDPVYMDSPGSQIKLTYIGGETRYFLQKGAHYLSKDKKPFRSIDASAGVGLLAILDKYS